jgi:Tfp pilus assembly protein PilX
MRNVSLRSEKGVALPVASGMLRVVTLLIVGFFTVALRVNDTSGDDRRSKRALAAAEAGLQTAIYRLNSLNASASLNASKCLRAGWENPLATGECAGYTDSTSLGNGASFTYYVTPASATASASCATVPGVATSTSDRCITSVGTVNGVTRRIQTRVVAEPIIPPFNKTGLIGKSLVFAYNSANLNTDVGSNLEVIFENSVNVYDNEAINVDGKVMLLEGGTYQYENSVKVDGGTEYITTPFEMALPDFEAIENSNNNSTLTSDLGTSWNSTTRRITIASGDKTIRPGTYHVCGVHLGNSVKLKFSHTGGARTRIFVDSPWRTGSMCSTQSDINAGAFTADNSVEINKEVGEREELLKIYMYGTPYNDTRDTFASWCTDGFTGGQTGECRSDFMLDNSVSFYGSVYAPNSSVQAHNSVTWQGSVAADKIRFYNSINFQVTGPTIAQGGEGSGAAERRGWAECRPERTVTTDPESGC